MRCKECGNDFSARMDGKTLKNRTHCFECSPFKPGGDSRGGGANKNTRWYARQKELFGKDPITLRREARKRFILQQVGLACQFCGYGRCLRNLTFHHVYGKETQLSTREFQNKLTSLLMELAKCVVACHNCHGEIHDGLVQAGIVERKRSEFESALAPLRCKRWSDVMDHFDSVRNKYETEKQRILSGHRQTGDIRVRRERPKHDKREVRWPSHEQLALLVWEKPVTQLARELGVSDKAVAKRCKRLSISTPRPGYWSRQRSRVR